MAAAPDRRRVRAGTRGTTALAAALVLALACLTAAASTATAAGRPAVRPAGARASVVPGRVLVAFTAARAKARRSALATVDGRVKRRLGLPGAAAVVGIPAGRSPVAAARRLNASPGVAWAQPDVIRRLSLEPDDEFFGEQWALRNVGQDGGTPGVDIAAPAAWERTTGDAAIGVGVVDSGIDADHPDLATNVDTGRGRDFVDEDTDPDDLNGHGTHVAGTIGAAGDDGVGIAGVTWRSRLVALRVCRADGSCADSDIVEGFREAGRLGLRVVNASLGGPGASPAMQAAVATAPSTLFVVAAGNEGQNVDGAPVYPCALPHLNVICVAATDRRDALASFSNRGARAVDLAAPGDDIVSDYPGSRLAILSGTSMASPHVAGAAALVLAHRPALSVAGLRAALLASVDPVPGLLGHVATAGRLDVAAALARAETIGTTSPAPPPPLPPPPTASPPPAAVPPPPPPPSVTWPTARARPLTSTVRATRAGRVPIRVACTARGTDRCRGTVALSVLRRGRRTGVGIAGFSVPVGATRTIEIALVARARRDLRLRGRLVTRIGMTTHPPGAGRGARVTAPLTVRRAT